MKPPSIAGYKLGAEIGRTASSVVFRGQSDKGQAVAVKILLDLEADGLARFEREQRLLASLGPERGFVPLLEKGATPLGPYLVMPLLTGGTLRTRLRKGTIGIDEALGLARRISRALGAAHDLGIVHRDVKPDNILFDEKGRCFVADLGIGKHFRRDLPGAAESSPLTSADVVLGTRGYMAPEQLRSTVDAEPRADVFAVGAILFECLAGRRVYDTLVNVEGQIAASVPTLPELRGDTPPWLVTVVHRCLSVDPGQRFRDGHALARALEGEPVTVATVRDEVERPRTVPPGAVAVGLAALAVAFAVALGVVVSRQGTKDARIQELEKELAAGRAAAAAPRPKEPGVDVPLALAVFRRAIESESRGRPGAAVADLDGLVKAHPGAAVLWAERARARLATFDVAGAIEDATKAHELDAELALALAVRADARSNSAYSTPAFERARADAERAHRLDEQSAYAVAVLGEVESYLGDQPRAIATLTRAIEMDRNLALAWMGRSRCHLVSATSPDDAEMQRALEDADRALALDPGLALAHAYRAWGLCGRDVKLALQECRAALDRGSALPRVLSIVAWVETWANRLDDAIAHCDAAIQIDGAEHTAYRNRGRARRLKGNLAGALADLTRCVELVPDGLQADKVRMEIAEIQADLKKAAK